MCARTQAWLITGRHLRDAHDPASMVTRDTLMGRLPQYPPRSASALTLTRVCMQSDTCTQREKDCVARKCNKTCMHTHAACRRSSAHARADKLACGTSGSNSLVADVLVRGLVSVSLFGEIWCEPHYPGWWSGVQPQTEWVLPETVSGVCGCDPRRVE